MKGARNRSWRERVYKKGVVFLYPLYLGLCLTLPKIDHFFLFTTTTTSCANLLHQSWRFLQNTRAHPAAAMRGGGCHCWLIELRGPFSSYRRCLSVKRERERKEKKKKKRKEKRKKIEERKRKARGNRWKLGQFKSEVECLLGKKVCGGKTWIICCNY